VEKLGTVITDFKAMLYPMVREQPFTGSVNIKLKYPGVLPYVTV
jgi:hypothetical protein